MAVPLDMTRNRLRVYIVGILPFTLTPTVGVYRFLCVLSRHGKHFGFRHSDRLVTGP